MVLVFICYRFVVVLSSVQAVVSLFVLVGCYKLAKWIWLILFLATIRGVVGIAVVALSGSFGCQSSLVGAFSLGISLVEVSPCIFFIYLSIEKPRQNPLDDAGAFFGLVCTGLVCRRPIPTRP